MTTPAALARRLDYQGPALFAYGFRPFFLAGAIWAALGVLLWLPQFFGAITLPTAMAPLDWHVHEMIFGYGAAVVAGFLLTAIPNWTGRLPVCGPPLVALAALWLSGRIAILLSQTVGAAVAAAIDLLFIVVLALVAVREVVAGSNWRNLRVLGVLGVLLVGNVVFHAEVLISGGADYGQRIGIGAIIGLIMLVGGRIIPSFTHNWIVRLNPGRLPAKFSRFDAVSLLVAAVALVGWIAAPRHPISGGLLILAGLLQFLRLARWAGDRTVADRLVLILHIGYAFVPLGFVLLGSAALWPAAVPYSAGIHAWAAGAVGTMTLAVMTRASLGHTGQPLVASTATQAIYLLVVLAAFARIAGAFTGEIALLSVAAVAWVAAFGVFVFAYGPLLAGQPPVWSGRS
jgi:uncharacterized protein involved in response to NO